MTDISKKALQKVRNWDHVFYMCYSILFQNDFEEVKIITLIDSASKVNAINSSYTIKQIFKKQMIDFDIQKIDGFFLEIYGIFIAAFQVLNKLG